MRKPLIAFGILLVAGGIGVLEYSFFPERVQPLEVTGNIAGTGEDTTNNVTRFDIPLSQISEKNFEVIGIRNVIKKRSNVVSHLFGTIVLRPQEERMAVVKSDFFQEGNAVMLVSTYEIFPMHQATVSQAFAGLKSAFEKKFVNDLETGIHQTDDFGLHSFYFNSAAHPERAFVLAVQKERLVGFEYSKENHNTLLPLIQQLFPSKQE